MSNNNAKKNCSDIGLNLHIFSFSSRFLFCFLENIAINRENNFPTEVENNTGWWILTT